MNAVDRVLGWLAGWAVTEPVQYGAAVLLLIGAVAVLAGGWTLWAHARAELDAGDRQ